MFDVIEMYSDKEDPGMFPFGRRVFTDGFHWRHYLRDARKASKKWEFTTSMVWVIPPRQTLRDLELFLEYVTGQDPEMSITRYHTYCRSREGKDVHNAGPILIPVDQLRGGPENRIVHLDHTPTNHMGYRVYRVGKDTEIPHYSEHTWMVPEDCTIGENSFDAMLEPDKIDPSKKFAYGTMANTGVGSLMAGPRLEPRRKPGETVEIVDGGYIPVTAIPPEKPVYQGVMLSYYEECDDTFFRVRDKLDMKRVENVKGIGNAHYRAAEITDSEYIWVVDADCMIDEEFDFCFKVPDFYHPTVFVWASRNNVNDLAYSNGGLKLFHRESILKHKGEKLQYTDFTESLNKYCDHYDSSQIAGTTMIDQTPFAAWKSGFREGYKLYWKAKAGDKLAHERLSVWCTKSKTANGKYALMGANHAVNVATKVSPKQINNYDWLDTEWKKFK